MVLIEFITGIAHIRDNNFSVVRKVVDDLRPVFVSGDCLVDAPHFDSFIYCTAVSAAAFEQEVLRPDETPARR
jgi:hypothetical protein